jgi:hypothetical protein
VNCMEEEEMRERDETQCTLGGGRVEKQLPCNVGRM